MAQACKIFLSLAEGRWSSGPVGLQGEFQDSQGDADNSCLEKTKHIKRNLTIL